MNPTIKDVAKHAGVSVATVSRYLNHSPLIAPASAEKVRASIDELHYEPNFIAKSLSKQQSLNVAFVVDNKGTAGDEYFLRIQYGAEQNLTKKGYFFLVISVDGEVSGNELIRRLIKEKRIDGVILPAELASSSMISMLQELSVAFVVFGRSDNKDICLLDLDNVMGGRLATEKLLQGQAKKIGFVTNSFDKVFARDRYAGCLLAMKEAKLSLEDIQIGCFDHQDGFEYIWNQDKLCDAYIVTDNMVAFGMLKAMEKRNIGVPEEVQIVSFDDTILTKVSTPPMTVIDIDVTELGRRAANMLLEQMEHVEKVQNQCWIPVTLIERGTTKK